MPYSSINLVMMAKENTLFVFSCLFALPLLAQNCDCKSDFEWLKKTFVENDAVYSYVLERKGQAALDYHTKVIRLK